MAPKPWISIPNIKIYFETKFRPNHRIFVFWWPFWIQNGHHSKPTMEINSQHHNLLGNQISPKSEDFCIWRPLCTLGTMATAAILNFFNPQKLPHTTVDIPTKFHERNPNFFKSFFVSMATAAKFVHPIPIFLVYLVPLDVDAVPIKFHQFLFGE
jgi:hypothetical protein